MKYLGIEPKKPRVAVFDFTGCEGCQLQLSNKEETLVPFLKSIEIVSFREIETRSSDQYDVALIDGCISRADEIERLLTIRKRAKLIVALGSCASFGGVNKLKNAYNLADANREVYGEQAKETMLVRPAHEIVPVDIEIPGCPVSKEEVERIIQYLVWEIPFTFPVYPVCYECKQNYAICRFDMGELCLGPITRGGCHAPCPTGGLGCWGCRGPLADGNFAEFFDIAEKHGFSEEEVHERLSFFGGFEEVLCQKEQS